MNGSRKLVVVGDSAFAEIACEYFRHDSSYEVVAFSVERDYLKKESLADLPVVAFEELEHRYSPQSHDVFVAVTYAQMNRLRARLVGAAREKGYKLASYVSSKAFVWRNVLLGEHCFVFEANVLQPFVRIGDNVILWSGNHIGHHSTIGDNCFVSSHVVISGFVTIGRNCFLGVNCCIPNNVTIGDDCWIGPGITINKNAAAGRIYRGAPPEVMKVGSLEFFGVEGGTAKTE